MEDLTGWLKLQQAAIEKALKKHLPRGNCRPAVLHEAMRYSVFVGGKRLRPILCLAAAESCGGTLEGALLPACAVEVLHTYSLIHDDLPCMDDDDLRRGKPTSHKIYGEGMAVLAGDALLTEAFIMLAQAPATKRYTGADYIAELAQAAGSKKLIGGQVLDLEGEGKSLSKKQLVQIHEAKTSALLTAAVKLGGMTANATAKELKCLEQFGYNLGLAYQVVDDILDLVQTTDVLGKTAGKDLVAEKSTYPAIMGLEASRKEARRLTENAMDALDGLGKKGARLNQIASYLLERKF